MSAAGTPDRYLILGNPENRRVGLFRSALERRGFPEPVVVSHLGALRTDVLEDLDPGPRTVRIDAVGENADVELELLRLGWEDASVSACSSIAPEVLERSPPAHGQIVAPRQHHFGFVRYLRRLEGLFARRPEWRILSPPAEVELLFDKQRTAALHRRAGVPVPESLSSDGMEGADDLLDALAERGWRSAFVKLGCGSSASCLAVVRSGAARSRGTAGRRHLMTTIRRTPDGWFNSLRVQRVDDPAGVAEILGFLLREGSHVEREVLKARLDGAFMDCRILAVAGEPAFAVVRQSRHPITNLHLGGWRGRLWRLLAAVPADQREAALESCRRVAELHGVFQVGIDLMFEPGWRGHRVLEANAFGDLLPGLERDGLDVSEWQVREAARVRREEAGAADV